MSLVCLHDKKEIEKYLRQNIYLQLYQIGDLDDFFWSHTIWFGLKLDNEVTAIALLYLGQSPPTLLALSENPNKMYELIKLIINFLPHRFYAHLSPGLESTFSCTHDLEPHGEFYKMALYGEVGVSNDDFVEIVRLSQVNLDEIQKFYKESYPGNWFDPRMLETNQYYGIRKSKNLISIAGIHVYSQRYKVAALGNIATHPSHRGKGYGIKVTARLCQSLSKEVKHIGLNVKINNKPAISLYKKLGFKIMASFGEFTIQKKFKS